jgi:hypothetical protein
MRTSLFVVLAVTATGCFGTLKPRMEWRGAGEADPGRDRGVETQFHDTSGKALEAAPATQPAVKVMLETIPEGIELKENVLSVKDGYQHQILGRFNLKGDAGFFPGYEAGWKGPVCYPQRVLALLTLGVWMLVPTSYPCNVSDRREKEYWIDQAKQAAASAGGDLVLGHYLAEGKEDAWGIEGFVLKADPAATGNGKEKSGGPDPSTTKI